MVFIVYQETAGFQQISGLCLTLKSNKSENALLFQIVVCINFFAQQPLTALQQRQVSAS